MKKDELEKLITEYKPQYIYQRYNGRLTKFEVVKDNYLVDTDTGMSFDFKSHMMLGKLSKDLNDLIEEHDIIEFEYDGAVYKEEVIRYDDGDTYYYELSFSPEDGIGYNISIFDEYIKILSILTHEQFEQIKYKVKEN